MMDLANYIRDARSRVNIYIRRAATNFKPSPSLVNGTYTFMNELGHEVSQR